MKCANRILYKYGSWGDEYFRRILLTSSIYYAPPYKFNDAFDCRVNPRWDLQTDEEVLQGYKYFLSQKEPSLSVAELDGKAREWAAQGKLRDQSHLLGFREHYEKELDKFYGIFCLTIDPVNLIMWGQYADKHRGICIGFDYNTLVERFNQLAVENELAISPHDVEYLDNYPVIKPPPIDDDNANSEFMIKQLTTKYSGWQFEMEVRFISHGKSDFQCKIPKTSIKIINFGCNISNDHMAEIRKLLSDMSYNVTSYQMSKLSDAFGLEPKPI